MRAPVSAPTFSGELSHRETVEMLTPASKATVSIVDPDLDITPNLSFYPRTMM
jgi:hypothetical protein